MVKLVLPCGEVCCENFFVMTVSCPTEFGEAQFRVFVSKNILIHQNAAILLISATRSGEAMFTSLQAWHAGVAGMWCGSCVRCVTFLFVHDRNCFQVFFHVRTVLTGPYEGVIAETLQGSGGTAVAGWRGMKRFHFLEVPLKAERQ